MNATFFIELIAGAFIIAAVALLAARYERHLFDRRFPALNDAEETN